MVPHNRLAINVLRSGVGRLVHLVQAAVNGWNWTEVASVADEVTEITVHPTESQEIRIFSSAIAMVVEGLPFTTAVKLGSLQLLYWLNTCLDDEWHTSLVVVKVPPRNH